MKPDREATFRRKLGPTDGNDNEANSLRSAFIQLNTDLGQDSRIFGLEGTEKPAGQT